MCGGFRGAETPALQPTIAYIRPEAMGSGLAALVVLGMRGDIVQEFEHDM